MPTNRRKPHVGATGSSHGALAASTTWRLVVGPVLVSAAVAATSAIALGLLRPAGRFR